MILNVMIFIKTVVLNVISTFIVQWLNVKNLIDFTLNFLLFSNFIFTMQSYNAGILTAVSNRIGDLAVFFDTIL